MKTQYRKLLKLSTYFLAAIASLAIIATIVYFVAFKNNSETPAAKKPRGAVTTNGHECAPIGASILDKGGSAVDAAIAALFCEGVAMPQSMGLGGGFLMTIYTRENRQVESLNARETAPGVANETMYGTDQDKASKGGLAVAVPGELRGYWVAHRKYGKLPWNELVAPTIQLCKDGILVTPYLAQMFRDKFSIIQGDPGLSDTFINPKTGETYKENEKVIRPRLVKTLEVIAAEGGDAIHNGSLTQILVDDIQKAGGVISVQDLNEYQPVWQESITVGLRSNLTLYTSPPPGSGVILGFILSILNNFLDYDNPGSFTNVQRIIESFKHGYGKRTEMGDPDFVDLDPLIRNLTSPEYAALIRTQIKDDKTSNDPGDYGAETTLPEDHGTAHISVLAPNGDAVSVTSTVNLYFGAQFMSLQTGIILNDEMDDFSYPLFNNSYNIPPSKANFAAPKKRPLSSMCPSIIVDESGDVKLVAGAAGGTKITTSTALVTVRNLYLNQHIADAINDKRFHHQLFPMQIDLEQSYENETEFLEALGTVGHDVNLVSENGFSAITAISTVHSGIEAGVDKRRPGAISFVY